MFTPIIIMSFALITEEKNETERHTDVSVGVGWPATSITYEGPHDFDFAPGRLFAVFEGWDATKMRSHSLH
jgi:hypothetical protein